MGLITKTVKTKVPANLISHYENLGYEIPKKKATASSKKKYKKDWVYDHSALLEVKVEDLPTSSHQPVECTCDYCGETTKIGYFNYTKRTNRYPYKIACPKCASKKQSEFFMGKYGVSNISQLESTKEKVRATNMQNYGVNYPSQNDNIKEKIRNNNMQKYGVEHVMHVESIVKKCRETLYRHYGDNLPLYSEETREKIAKSLYLNSSCATSSQQIYLSNLYKMELNYPLVYYNVDMFDMETNIYLEVDGSGHDLCVRLDNITPEEFKQREIKRYYVLKNHGYKAVRIISRHDKYPSDLILLQMLDDAKQYFSDYPNHSWITFDIDEGVVKNAEYERSFSYGELRKISKSDLKSA